MTVKIYSGKDCVNGAVYPHFTLIYYAGVVRKKKRFADLKLATQDAGFAA